MYHKFLFQHSTSTLLEVISAGAAVAAAATAAVLSHFCAAIILYADAIEINWCDLLDAADETLDNRQLNAAFT